MNLIKKTLHVLNTNQKQYLILIFFLVLVNIVVETLSLGLILPVVALLVDYDRLISYNIVSVYIDYLNLDNQNKVIIFGLSLLVFVYFCKNIFLAFFAYIQAKKIFLQK